MVTYLHLDYNMFSVILGRIFSCSQPKLSQFEVKYWPENFSHCFRKDEKILNAD